MKKTYWNYRVVRRTDGTLSICEVYYDKNDKPDGWCDTADISGAANKAELAEKIEMVRQELAWLEQALNKSFLAETKTGKLKADRKAKPKGKK